MRIQKITHKNIVRIYEITIILLTIRYFLFFSAVLTVNNIIDNFLLFVALGGCCLTIWNHPREKKETLLYVCLGVLAMYTSYATRSFTVIASLLSILAVGYGGLDTYLKISKRVLWSGIAVQSTLVLLQYFFFGENNIYHEDGNTIRFCLGYGHANGLAFSLIHLMLIDLWQNYGSKNWQYKLFFLMKIGIGYLLTRSEALLGVLFIGLLLFWMAEKKVLSTAMLHLGAKSVGPVCAIVTWILARYYWDLPVNQICTYSTFLMRFKLNAYALEKQGLSWIGKMLYSGPVAWEESWGLTAIALDSVYGHFFVSVGVVWLIILLWSILKITKKNDSRISIMLILWAIYGLMEMHCIHAPVFLPMMVISQVISPHKGCKEAT